MNIVDAILFQCRRQPPVAAICVPGQERGLISYRRLEQSIHNISRRLLSLSVAPGSIVAVSIKDAIFHAAMLLALTRLGVVTLSVRDRVPPLPFKIDGLITDVRLPAAIDRVAMVDPSWMEGDGDPIESRYASLTNESDIVRIVLTAADHGNLRGVAISQRVLSDRIGWHLAMSGNRLPRYDRFYCDLPFPSMLGFQFLIYSLLRGGTMVFPGDRFDSTLLAIDEYKVQCLIAQPEGLELFVRWFDTIPAYQSNLELIFCADGVLSPSLSERARSRICSHVSMAYGATEVGAFASASAHEIVGTPGAVGFVTPGAAVQIVDGSGTLLSHGREGLIRIRSNCAVDGYLGDPEETTRAFRSGWFYSGDVGMFGADDLLIVTGRGKRH